MTRSCSTPSKDPFDRAPRLWRTEDLGGLELLRATLSDFSFRPHAHEEFFIALTEDGLATPTYRGGKHVIGPGDLLVLNPEEAHAGGASANGMWKYRALYPRPSLLQEMMAEFPTQRLFTPYFHNPVVRDRAVGARLHRYHVLTEAAGSSALERQAHLVEALVLLIGRHTVPLRPPRSPGREQRAVRLSREYLGDHVGENVTLKALSNFVGLSPFYLCRVFREALGMAPHAYHAQVRIQHAKARLRDREPISLVAAETGFCDQAHLTRSLRRIVGVTPGQYARSLRAVS